MGDIASMLLVYGTRMNEIYLQKNTCIRGTWYNTQCTAVCTYLFVVVFILRTLRACNWRVADEKMSKGGGGLIFVVSSVEYSSSL